MSNKDRESLVFAVGNHMKFHKILDMKPSKIAKLASDDNWDVLVAVGRADEYARGNAFMYSGEFEKIIDKAIKIKEKYGMARVNQTLKLVDGNHIMNLLGLKPGPKVGEIIRNVTKIIMDKGIDPNDTEKVDDIIRSFT
jgi:hypothetical protein